MTKFALPALVCALLGATFTSPAHAFCRAKACDTKPAYDDIWQDMPDASCARDEFDCQREGVPLFWHQRCLSFSVQEDGSQRSGVSYDTVHAAAVAAFSSWMNVDCGGKRPSFVINDLGPAQCNVPEFNDTRPNANVIMFRDASFARPEDGIPFDAIALTTLSYNRETGELFGADIELNAANWNFVTGPLRAGNDVDLQAVLTHETGHFLGLSHGSPQDVTMYWRYLPTAERRILKQDDKDGICAVFPPGQAVNQDQCAPFNGYSPECQPDTPLEEDGDCAIVPGAPRGSGFAAFAAALGFFALLRRRRR